MRTLITGATGFVGSHLVECLRQAGEDDLHGLSRQADWPAGAEHLAGQAVLHVADLTRPHEVEDVLRSIRPERVFHLAGYANTGRSFHEPELAWADNWQATFHLYQALARLGLGARTLFVSSGLVYGNPPGADHLFAETDPLYPASPYAASKAAADLLSYQVTCHPGLDVVRIRCFNQIGPRQSPDYATANFARQIAAIERGRQPPLLECGDLSAQRDLTDVRDMVRAFVVLMEAGKTGEVYNAGSGTAHSMQAILDRMLALTGAPIEVRQRLDPQRRVEASVTRADNRRLRETTGWTPEFSLDRSLADLLDYWRRQTPASAASGAA
jgi:GDP-4-dehydro-6-deoxy-D-mannose reductase